MRNSLWIGVVIAVGLAIFCGHASAEEAKDIPNFLKDAKVGEWVLYALPGGTMQQRQTVTAVSDEFLTLKTETIMNGKTLATNEMKLPLNQKPQEAATKETPKPVITREKITVNIDGADKEIECYVMAMKMRGKTFKSYLSNDVPVMGLAKSQMGDMVTMKLIKCGTKPAKK